MNIQNMKKGLLAGVLVGVLVPTLVFGAVMRGGEEVSIAKSETIEDNFYAAGGSISVGGVVEGDAIVFGGNILISENVTDDIAAAGGTVTILGDSGGDVRVAGGTVLVAGNVAGDLFIAGGQVTIASDVTIGKDLVVAGGQVTLDGVVEGDVEMIGGVATLNGRVKGSVKAQVDERLSLGESSIIEGGLAYTAKDKDVLDVTEGATVTGGVTFEEREAMAFEKTEEAKSAMLAALGAFAVIKLFGCIASALLIIWFFKRFTSSVVRTVVENPLRMLGRGFVILFIVPVAIVLLCITLLGTPLAFMTGLSYMLLIALSCMYSGIVLGAWVSKVIQKAEMAKVTWKNAIGGIVLLTLLGTIPYVGCIISFFVFLVTFGSITHLAEKKLWSDR